MSGEQKVLQGTADIAANGRVDRNVRRLADEEALCFVVRKSDGKFLRGARLWKWTGDWRRAALLTPGFVREYCLGKRYGIESMDDVVLYNVQMPSNA